MEPAIVTRGLEKRFGDAVALDGLDLAVPCGEVFGFLGPNGAGKTTTIRLLLDHLRPTAGSMAVLGLDPRRDGVALRRRVGYLPGDLVLPPRLTARAHLADEAAVRGVDTRAAVEELAARFDAALDRPMGELSLGNRRKIGLIGAFAHDPELLVLDEPTGGLDPLVQHTFRTLVRERVAAGRTVFLSSHLLDEVQHVADRVGVMRRGRLVTEDRVDALVARFVRTFVVRFEGPAPDPEALRSVGGVDDVVVRRDGMATVVEVVVSGAAGALLAAVAPWRPADLHTREGDLEDVFLGYYRSEGP